MPHQKWLNQTDTVHKKEFRLSPSLNIGPQNAKVKICFVLFSQNGGTLTKIKINTERFCRNRILLFLCKGTVNIIERHTFLCQENGSSQQTGFADWLGTCFPKGGRQSSRHTSTHNRTDSKYFINNLICTLLQYQCEQTYWQSSQNIRLISLFQANSQLGRERPSCHSFSDNSAGRFWALLYTSSIWVFTVEDHFSLTGNSGTKLCFKKKDTGKSGGSNRYSWSSADSALLLQKCTYFT